MKKTSAHLSEDGRPWPAALWSESTGFVDSIIFAPSSEYLPVSPGFPSHRGPFRPPRGDAILDLLLLQIRSVTICDSPPVPSACTPPRPHAILNIPPDFLPFSLPERVRHQLSLSPAGQVQRPCHYHQGQAGWPLGLCGLDPPTQTSACELLGLAQLLPGMGVGEEACFSLVQLQLDQGTIKLTARGATRGVRTQGGEARTK